MGQKIKSMSIVSLKKYNILNLYIKLYYLYDNMTKLCLCMIVKNESKIIKKCLNSIADYLDYWVISDTGSTDGTQDIIKSFFKEKGISGELHEDKWVNFGYNRSLYLKYAKNKSDFLIMLDADMIANIKDLNFKNKLSNINTAYLIKYEGNNSYRQNLLVSSNIQWKYVGVTHEYITSDEKYKVENNDDIMINHIGNGNNKKDKFTRDITLLSQGIKDEPNNVRYHFYLAQSYKDIGDYKNAIKYYKKRVEMGGWYEEVYYSLYMIGLCKQNDGLDFENEILYDYLKAYNYNKNRLEALYEIVKYYRQNEKYQEGYAYGILRIKNSYPKDLLFIDRDIHTFKFKDEVAICASRVNDHKLAIKLNNELLNLDCLNDNYRNRIQNNLNISLNSDKYAKFTECLFDMKKTLDENNQEFFLMAGTLLGCIRNHDFISHDGDIDIGIFYDNFNIDIINKIKESKKFTLTHILGKIENSYEMKFTHINNISIDIFLNYKIINNYYYCTSFFGICDLKKEGYCKWGNTIENLISIPFKGNNFLVPSNFEEYLEECYGNDWRIPKEFSYWDGLDGEYKNLIN